MLSLSPPSCRCGGYVRCSVLLYVFSPFHLRSPPRKGWPHCVDCRCCFAREMDRIKWNSEAVSCTFTVLHVHTYIHTYNHHCGLSVESLVRAWHGRGAKPARTYLPTYLPGRIFEGALDDKSCVADVYQRYYCRPGQPPRESPSLLPRFTDPPPLPSIRAPVFLCRSVRSSVVAVVFFFSSSVFLLFSSI